MTLGDALLLLVAFLLGCGVAYAVKFYAERLDLVDIPNHRSSHKTSTPSGGGMGIVLGGTVAGISLVLLKGVEPFLWFAIIFLSLIIAILGLADDTRNVSAKVRFSIQLVSVVAMLLTFHQLPDLSLPFSISASGLILLFLILFAAVWWINLFNFMDGIDGIAAMQAIFMLLAAAGLSIVGQLGSEPPALFWWMLCLAAANLGFLLLNWAPAKIFMGDVGSTYLGFMIIALALLSLQAGMLSYQVWLILAATFLTDATVTLLTRLLRGERVYEAHRSHSYQRLTRHWGRHSSVTLIFFGINVIWLLPLALFAVVWPQWNWEFVLIAYAPLIVAAATLGAGRQDKRNSSY